MMQSHDGHVSTWLHYFYPLDSPLILALSGEPPVISALESHQHVSGYRQSGLPRWVYTLLCPLCKWDTRSCLCAWGWFNSQIPMPSRCLTRSVFNVDSSTGQFIILSDQLIYVLCAAQHTWMSCRASNVMWKHTTANKYCFPLDHTCYGNWWIFRWLDYLPRLRSLHLGCYTY